MDKQKLIELIDKYLAGHASAQEQEQFFFLLDQPEHQLLLEEILQEQYKSGLFDSEPNEKLRQIVQARLLKAIKERPSKKKARLVTFRTMAVAASIIVIIGLALVGILTNNHKPTALPPVAQTHDIAAPINARAVITLANGTKVYLDSVGNGTIAQQNDIAVVKNSEGGISYVNAAGAGGIPPAGGGARRAGMDQNTLYNPRGSKVISLSLSDGTKVWLNSESSLRYPIAFNGSTREVEITGEAFFEVKHNPKQPFQVHLPNGCLVEDIGTAFNVNAYPDEESMKTTLIEGSVRVSDITAMSAVTKQTPPSVVLSPGAQASINQADSKITRIEVQKADLDEVTAWKNNLFSFSNADVKTILRQVARLYDLQVVYETNPPAKQITGDAPRNISLQSLLKILELNDVKLKLEGKKIIVQ